MRLFLATLALSALVLPMSAKDSIDVNDLVKQNLNSIGNEEVRTAVKTLAAEGAVQFRVVSGGAGTLDGKLVFVSEGNKVVTLLKLPNPSYHGERFVCDGKKTLIANVRPGSYSNFGQFVKVHDEILTEGLWGGTLSTGWALANLDARKPKLQYQGLKKVDGQEMHQVRYVPAKHSDLEIMLYFDPTTFRHVMTAYSLTINPQMGRSDIETARQDSAHFRLEERFSAFATTDGITLPQHWKIQFTSDVPEDFRGEVPGTGGAVSPGEQEGHPISPGASRSSVNQFEVSVASVSRNVTLDPKNFEVK